jgi:hypothetical protein
MHRQAAVACDTRLLRIRSHASTPPAHQRCTDSPSGWLVSPPHLLSHMLGCACRLRDWHSLWSRFQTGSSIRFCTARNSAELLSRSHNPARATPAAPGD